MTLGQLARDFFESPELQTLFIRAATTSTGCFPDDVPGLQGLIHCLPLTLSFEPAAIAIGGSQAITDALVAAGRRFGVQYETSCEVDRIVVQGNRATRRGAHRRNADRDRPRDQQPRSAAHRAAAPARARGRCDAAAASRQHPLRPRTAVLGQPGDSRAAPLRGRTRQPRGRCAAAPVLGPQGPRLPRSPLPARDLPETDLPAGRMCSAPVDSLWDHTRAPAGSHIVGVEEFAAPRRSFSPGRWREIKEEFCQHLLRRWAAYAPNMTAENVIAMRVYGPDDIERERPNMIEGGYSTASTIASQVGRFRPVPGLNGYRLLLENLYDCSANLHSGPGHRTGIELQLLCPDRARSRARARIDRGMSDPRLAGKRVLVTGAGQGLGRAFTAAPRRPRRVGDRLRHRRGGARADRDPGGRTGAPRWCR